MLGTPILYPKLIAGGENCSESKIIRVLDSSFSISLKKSEQVLAETLEKYPQQSANIQKGLIQLPGFKRPLPRYAYHGTSIFHAWLSDPEYINYDSFSPLCFDHFDRALFFASYNFNSMLSTPSYYIFTNSYERHTKICPAWDFPFLPHKKQKELFADFFVQKTNSIQNMLISVDLFKIACERPQDLLSKNIAEEFVRIRRVKWSDATCLIFPPESPIQFHQDNLTFKIFPLNNPYILKQEFQKLQLENISLELIQKVPEKICIEK